MKKLTFLFSAFLAVFLFSCEQEKNARIEVWLTDAPGDFQEVNIEVQGVEIHSNQNDNGRGWQSLNVTPTMYDLLKLTNGQETLLGALELPGGRLSQIRLILGENNTVKINNAVFSLSTPSAQQSGLKVQVHEVLAEGITYKIVLDFDAAKSVIETGAGTYTLKPVVRALTEAQDGAIKGKVDPAGIVSIAVVSGEEIITTTSSDENGDFLIRGLEAGTYRLLFDPAGNGPVTEKSAVHVTLGEVTDLEVVAMIQ